MGSKVRIVKLQRCIEYIGPEDAVSTNINASCRIPRLGSLGKLSKSSCIIREVSCKILPTIPQEYEELLGAVKKRIGEV